MSNQYTGVVKKVKFGRESFYIFDLKIDSGPTVAVRGNVVGFPIHPGVWVSLEGDKVNDKKWGEQIQIIKAPSKPKALSKESIMSLLISGGFAVEAMRIRKIEDLSLDNILNYDYLKSFDIDDNTITVVQTAIDSVLNASSYADGLRNIGVPDSKIDKVIDVFGPTACDIITKNPWSLSKIEGISLKEMDDIASRIGNFTGPERLAGLMVISMKGWCSINTYIPSRELLNRMTILTDESVENIAAAVRHCVANNDMVVDKVSSPGITACYMPVRYEEETYCASKIASRVLTEDFISSYVKRESVKRKIDDFVATVEAMILDESVSLGIDLDGNQVFGVRNILVNPVSILTGLPGTGKSTSIKVITSLLSRMGATFCMMAPTGVAAKRLSRITGFHAKTIHRALGAQPEGKKVDDKVSFVSWKYDESNPLNYDVVIVDESSMIDQFVFTKLIMATSRKNTRVVFVGDAAQLPSVGYGNVLRDMIRSEVIPVTSLTKIYRQNEKSHIILASHDIHYGRNPRCEGDFQFIEMESESSIHDKIVDLSIMSNESGDTWQVLSPRYAGTVGVDNLNSSLRNVMNPKTDMSYSMKYGDIELISNDRVMVIKNNYSLGICNGDVGIVKSMSHEEKKITITIDGESEFGCKIAYRDTPNFLRLSYACTVHKYQGMEIDVIIMPIIDAFAHQLQRNLLYTAVTRAKKRVYLIGSRSALMKAVNNNKEDERKTMLSERLKQNFVSCS